ncbi:MAG TPA: 2-succinyl-6-hydroxy-2,4-cyclohexadiene-1-carboxylate synthase [Solirubrobacteraceae bacterium]|nr:2-succinyl-6-hydroxy-2,4-cyclohexadiene-1-carboxylate synthase [Solirubrobacteraceae bacterium]
MEDPPVLVLLHGFTNTGASWRPVVRALGERYRAMAPDIRGHGSASGCRPVTLEAVIDDVAALTQRPFTLAGYSMGARIALHAALALPERVERLILIGGSPGLQDTAERTSRRESDERLAGDIEASDIDTFARRWAEIPVLTGLSPELARQVHADRRRNHPAGLAAALRGLGTGALPSLWDRLPELSCPVVLVAGERDEKFRQLARAMADRVPDSTVAVIPGAGHAAHIEVPTAVAAVLSGGQ